MLAKYVVARYKDIIAAQGVQGVRPSEIDFPGLIHEGVDNPSAITYYAPAFFTWPHASGPLVVFPGWVLAATCVPVPPGHDTLGKAGATAPSPCPPKHWSPGGLDWPLWDPAGVPPVQPGGCNWRRREARMPAPPQQHCCC